MHFLNGIQARIYCIVFACLALSIGVGFVFRSFVDQKEPADRLIVGMLPADAPFYSLDDRGNPEGFDVDVARAIAERMGKELIFSELGVPELFMALESRKIDMFLCGLSITRARLQKIAMVHYQGSGVTTFPLVFWKTAPDGIRSMDDLVGKNLTIAVLPATLQEDFARKFDSVTVKSIGNYAQIVMELQYGKVDAALFDEAISGFVTQFPELRVIDVPIGDFESLGHGIAIRKDNFELATHAERIVQQLKEEGIIAQFEHRWQMGSAS